MRGLLLASLLSLCSAGVKLGGATPLAIDDPDVGRATSLILAKFDELHPELTSTSALLRVTGASRQVVAGTITKVTLDLAPSTCSKPLTGCPAQEGAAPTTITGSVWSQPWRSFLEVKITE